MRTREADAILEKKIPLVGMRKIIAAGMKNSLNTAAQTSHRVSVDMTDASAFRAKLKEEGRKISFNDMVCMATIAALKEFPILNSEIRENAIYAKNYVNLGIAVAIPNGLIVPVVKDADLMNVTELSETIREMAGRAKNMKLKPDEYKGSTFTISNLGMYGLDSFVAIINQPDSGILAVGKIEKKPVVRDDQIVIRSMMDCTLSYDHRVVDGAIAAQFIMKIKENLEHPEALNWD